MINILVDEAYAFDYISILAIKNDRFKNQSLNLMNVCEAVKGQIGDKLFKDILESDEYKILKKANIETFEAVDKAKTNQVTAKYVDECNLGRYNAKVELQKKFFNNAVEEFKT